MNMMNRRGLITGLVGFVACAPAIVRAASIMPVRAWIDTPPPQPAWLVEPVNAKEMLWKAHARACAKISNLLDQGPVKRRVYQAFGLAKDADLILTEISFPEDIESFKQQLAAAATDRDNALNAIARLQMLERDMRPENWVPLKPVDDVTLGKRLQACNYLKACGE